jgi:hypothetical protein
MKKLIILLLILFLAGCNSSVIEEIPINTICSFEDSGISCSEPKFTAVQAEIVITNNYDYDIAFDSLLIPAAGTCGREFFGDAKASGYIIKKGISEKLSLVCNSIPKTDNIESEMSIRFIRQDTNVLTTIKGNVAGKIQ